MTDGYEVPLTLQQLTVRVSAQASCFVVVDLVEITVENANATEGVPYAPVRCVHRVDQSVSFAHQFKASAALGSNFEYALAHHALLCDDRHAPPNDVVLAPANMPFEATLLVGGRNRSLTFNIDPRGAAKPLPRPGHCRKDNATTELLVLALSVHSESNVAGWQGVKKRCWRAGGDAEAQGSIARRG